MKILFLIYHGLSNYSGISKKILSQINGLKANGHEVDLCHYEITDNRHRCWMINDNIIHDFGTDKLGALHKKISYTCIISHIKNGNYDFVYSRSYHNANPWTINLFKAFKRFGIKSVIEIPTYPYDQEYKTLPRQWQIELIMDKMFRNKLAKETDRIVTFTNHTTIFGQKTICISNAIDFNTIPMRKPKPKGNGYVLLAVAEVHYWHGLDRIIEGIGEYYMQGGKENICLHIAGYIMDTEMNGSVFSPGFKNQIQKYHLEDKIILHGPVYGKELNELFNSADFAIGSLGRHRCGITDIKTLKNREYAARGIPFIYSEYDEDFENMPYIIKATADDSPISIKELLKEIQRLKKLSPTQIRDSVTHLSWKEQMNKVVKEISNM